MVVISYNTKLIGESQDLINLRELLEWQRLVFNEASKEQFIESKNSIVILHSKVYNKVRKSHPKIPAQVVICAERECLAKYKSAKSNKHKKTKPHEKVKLSIQLDKRLYSIPKNDPFSIKITTANKRKTFKFQLYPKLKELLQKYKYCDPLIYENNGKLFISFCFDTRPKTKLKQKLTLGVDLGIRRSAAMSDGRIIIDRKFNKEKRKLRYLKRQLQSCRSKSAKRHFRKLKRKERNKNKNQSHLIANIILNTNADTIVLENLKSIKVKKYKYQNQNSISQVPLFDLRRIITYKAENVGKTTVLVCPSYTSKTDSITGKREGERRGCRFHATNGLVYDADINASINIAKLSKLPVSQGNLLDGQAIVTSPIVCKSLMLKDIGVLQAPG